MLRYAALAKFPGCHKRNRFNTKLKRRHIATLVMVLIGDGAQVLSFNSLILTGKANVIKYNIFNKSSFFICPVHLSNSPKILWEDKGRRDVCDIKSDTDGNRLVSCIFPNGIWALQKGK